MNWPLQEVMNAMRLDKMSEWRLRILSERINIDQVSVRMVSILNSLSLHVVLYGFRNELSDASRPQSCGFGT